MNYDAEQEDRAVGALLGLAIGDAIGTTLEFSERDTEVPVTDMVGGGPFHLRPGEWTDDTAMALCLAESLISCRNLDQMDLMRRFCRWWREGENSCTGTCFDIGIATRAALSFFERSGNPVAGSTDPNSAGNGSLMRMAPVAIYGHTARLTAERYAREQSLTTHGAPATVEACAYFSNLLVDAIEGQSKDSILRARTWRNDASVDQIAHGAWQRKPRTAIRSSGYVIDTLEASLWSVSRAADFREAVLIAANLGGDADTVAAIAGQLAGSLWGASGIPPGWVERLAWSARIRDAAERLYALGSAVATR